MKCCLSSQAANVLFYSLVTAWMAIRIGQPGRYQQQSLCGDKLQLYSPGIDIILNTRLTPITKQGRFYGCWKRW